MKKLRIVRLEQSDAGTLGVLVIEGNIFCVTLEPDAFDPDKPQIPAGTYNVKRFHGYKWKDTFEIIVPGHKYVLFHAGNVEADTEMCVLLGRYATNLRKERWIMNSGHTFNSFMQVMKNENKAVLQIVDFY